MATTITKVKQLVVGTAGENAVSLLKKDHRKVEALFAQFESSRTKIQRAKLIKEIVTELSIHATLEEKFVYPLLAEEGEKTREAYEEHHVVKLVLAELADLDGSEENVKAKVKVLSEMVEHHVQEEEGELLPALEETGTDLDALGAKLTSEKEKLKSKITKIGDKSKRRIGGAPARRNAKQSTRSRRAKRAS